MAQALENCYNHAWEAQSETEYLCNFPLHLSCRDGNIQTLSLLVETGRHSPCEEDNMFSWTPAHWAAYFGHLDCLRKVLSLMPSSSSPDIKSSKYSQAPSHNAAFAGHPHCLLWLLQSGSSIDLQDVMGETPLHKACRAGKMECVSLLAAMGANILLPNCNGDTAAKLALVCGHHAIAAFLTQSEIAKGFPASLNGLNGFSVMQTGITNGLNGGILPTSFGMKSIPTEFMSSGVRFNSLPSNSLFTTNGFIPGRKLGINGVTTASRKRSLHFEEEDVKRVRKTDFTEMSDVGEGTVCGTFHVAMTSVPMVTCSVMEHENLRTVEEGYNHALLERIISQVHGS